MHISIHGAGGGEVTGSAYLVQTRSAKVLVDFGLFQGSRKMESSNRLPKKGALDGLNAVVLTHAHLDHTGRLPLLLAANYTGPIHATPATIDMTDLILRDAARLQLADVERENRRRERQGQPPVEPLYTPADVEKLRPLFKALPYDRYQEMAPGIQVRVVEAGHMLGSVSVEMAIEEDGTKRVVVFSGDLGPRGAPLHRDPVPFRHADLVFLESTYGDRDHRSLKATLDELHQIVGKAIAARGKILVPVFAIGRTQMLLYLLAGAFQQGALKPFPIYVDSPMAIEATKLYGKHGELYDEEARALAQAGELLESIESVRFCSTADESRALNRLEGPCLIMAGSGMCNGGRILHHLRHNLARPGTTVLIVGYQSHGSLGRMLVDGVQAVTIFGEKIPVRASVHTIGGLSGHAGQSDLLHWLASLAPSRPRVLLTHGEDRARQPLARLIGERFQLRADLPGLGEVIDL